MALGQLADGAWHAWRSTPSGAAFGGVYVPVTHPTQPESSSKGVKAKRDAAITKMLQGWNAALALLQPAVTPDVPRPLVPYGAAFATSDCPTSPGGSSRGQPAVDVWQCRLGAAHGTR